MDVTPSRRVSVALQVEETTADDEILIDDRHCGTHGSETGRSEVIVGMEVGLESRYNKTDDVEPGLLRNDGVDCYDFLQVFVAFWLVRLFVTCFCLPREFPVLLPRLLPRPRAISVTG